MDRALPLEVVEYDSSVEVTGDISNMSAEEYLSWVRNQAEALPAVKRVNISLTAKQSHPSASYAPVVEEILPCPPEFIPNEEWQRGLLYSFSELRSMLQSRSELEEWKERKLSVPQLKDAVGWHLFCLADELVIPSVTSAAEAAMEESGNGQFGYSDLLLAGSQADISEGVKESAVQSLVRVDEIARDISSHISSAGMGPETDADHHVSSATLKATDNSPRTTTTSSPACTGVANEVCISSSSTAAVTAATAATAKRKRDLAYQLGITLTRVGGTGAEACAPHYDGEERNKQQVGISNDDDDDGEDDGDNYVGSDDDNDEIDASVLDQAFHANVRSALQAQEWQGPRNVTPSTAVLLQFDQALTQRLVTHHINWLEGRRLTPARGQWLYGLLARLEKPLHRETSASVRQLYRRCCALRYALCVDSPTFDADLAALNVLITIAGAYFGQGEEYDAFNAVLQREGKESEGNDEDDDDDDDNDEEAEDGYWEVGSADVDDEAKTEEVDEIQQEVDEFKNDDPYDDAEVVDGGMCILENERASPPASPSAHFATWVATSTVVAFPNSSTTTARLSASVTGGSQEDYRISHLHSQGRINASYSSCRIADKDGEVEEGEVEEGEVEEGEVEEGEAEIEADPDEMQSDDAHNAGKRPRTN